MKKIFALMTVGLLSACGDPTAPVAELDGVPVYKASFGSNLDNPNRTLEEGYEGALRSTAGWVWKYCENGMREVDRQSSQTYLYPTPSTRQLMWVHHILYVCK